MNTKWYGALIESCEIVKVVPVGTRYGIRVTFVEDADEVTIKQLKRPKSLAAAVEHFKSQGQCADDKEHNIPSWHEAVQATSKRANAHVFQNGATAIDQYITDLGIEELAVQAAIDYAECFAAAEYRMLAADGIQVREIKFGDLWPYVGRGFMPEYEEISLKQRADDDLHRVPWANGNANAFGEDRFLMLGSVLR